MPFIYLPNRVSRLISPDTIRRKEYIYIFLTAILFILSFPPIPAGFLIYFAFVPFIRLLIQNNPIHAFQKGYLIGLLINLAAFYWLVNYSVFNTGLIVLLNALQFALFGLLFSYLYKLFAKRFALALWPFLWTALEYLRQFGDLAFNWLNIAYTHTYYLTLIQICEITGYLGITLWIVVVNGLLYVLLHTNRNISRKFISGGIILTGFLILSLYGTQKLNQAGQSEQVKVSLIQPNIPLDLKWDPEFRYRNLDELLIRTEIALETGPDLVIWPETALPYMLRLDSVSIRRIREHVNKNNYNLLTGTLDYQAIKEDTLRHNAAILVEPQTELLQSYHKMRLVPVEEGIPFQRYISFLQSKQIYRRFLFPGKSAKLLNLPLESTEYDRRDSNNKSVNIGMMICYESIFPEPGRSYTEQGANVLIVITNDAWFGRSAQPFQHSQIGVLRAIENRKSVIQGANSGVSLIIDPLGRITQQTDIFEDSIISGKVELNSDQTIYSRIGDWPGCLSLALILISFIYGRLKQIRQAD